MKLILLLTFTFVSSMSFSAEFKRSALSYDAQSGTLGVYDYVPTSPTEYVVPLNDEADSALKKTTYRGCIIISGSRDIGIIFARSLRTCP